MQPSSGNFAAGSLPASERIERRDDGSDSIPATSRITDAPSAVEPLDDPLAKFNGPRETVTVSLPRELVDAIRAASGKRKFSRFVGRALAREYIDTQRAEFVAAMEAISGPVDPEWVQEFENLLDR